MADRRSLGDALTMSPEKLAFIQGGESNPTPKVVEVRKKETETTIDVTLGEEPKEATKTPRIRRRHKRPEADFSMPNANEVLDEVLIPLTTRLPHRLIQSLRRICLEKRLRHSKPDSIQEIVEAALEDWLEKQPEFD